MTLSRKQVVLGTAAVLALGAAAFLLIVFGGVASVAGTDYHTALVHWVLRTTMESSVRTHARGVQVPAGVNLQDRALAEKAFSHYSVACTSCHGAPGVKPAQWMVINPEAPPLVETAAKWNDAELCWIIKNGIKMTGMPALGPTHRDEHLWAIAAFVRQLPTMTPDEYQAMARRYEATKSSGHQHHGM